MVDVLRLERIANAIINYWSNEDLDRQEQLESIKMVAECLKGKDNRLAIELEEKIKEICNEEGLCPECYSDECECKVTESTYWQPKEGLLICHNCGYKEVLI